MPRTKPQQIKPESKAAIGWDDVAGADEAKAELQEVVEFLRDPERFNEARREGAEGHPAARPARHRQDAAGQGRRQRVRREVLLPVGRRVRRDVRRPRRRRASGACSTRRARTRPAIIFIDEIDAVGGERGSDNNSEREQTLNQLLVEMDGFGSTGDLVVIAASNLLEKLDPALLRPGRFDRQIFVSPPDVAGREAILQRAHARQAARRRRRPRR